MILRKDEIDELMTVVEEGARADKRTVKLFVEPAKGTLKRAKNRRHHLIFGRRGSGKSSLLIKSAQELVDESFPTVYIDLEPFKGHSYPDIILSVLITIFSKLRVYFEVNEKILRNKWYEFWKRKPTNQESEKIAIIAKLKLLEQELSERLFAGEVLNITNKIIDSNKKSKEQKGSVRIPIHTSSEIEGSIARAVERSHQQEQTEAYEKSKTDLLLNKMLEFRELFSKITTFSKKSVFLFLDDLYHVKKDNHAQLLDYLHRILKGNDGYLKVGTIRTRSKWYIHAPQPTGLKIGDDADEIDLDQTLEKFLSTKDFLRTILRAYIDKVNAPDLDEFVSDSGLDRLVLSSGGVARDFLGLFRKSILEGRERLRRDAKHHRGIKLTAEDVNVASGDYGDIKKEELQRDTDEDTKLLEEAFEKIKIFCIKVSKKNVFLVNIDASGQNYELLQELIDLRLIHLVKRRVTTKQNKGEVYRAYLLDVSQYTGERTQRGIELIDFWKDSRKEDLRKQRMIYNPDWSLDEIEQMARENENDKPTIEEQKKDGRSINKNDPPDSSKGSQGTLFD